MVKKAIKKRGYKPIFFIDISVPGLDPIAGTDLLEKIKPCVECGLYKTFSTPHGGGGPGGGAIGVSKCKRLS